MGGISLRWIFGWIYVAPKRSLNFIKAIIIITALKYGSGLLYEKSFAFTLPLVLLLSSLFFSHFWAKIQRRYSRIYFQCTSYNIMQYSLFHQIFSLFIIFLINHFFTLYTFISHCYFILFFTFFMCKLI